MAKTLTEMVCVCGNRRWRELRCLKCGAAAIKEKPAPH